MSMSGKTAIVTGAGAGGIGEGIASLIAAEGANVVVAEIREETGQQTVEAIRAAGGEASFLPVDISSPESVQTLADETAKRYGRIDYLVNNAALFGGMSLDPLMSIDWATLKKLFDINLFGALAVTRAVAPYMEKVGGGAICTTSSSAAWMAGGHYSVAKLATNGMIVSLSRELAPLNIRINAIAPGPTDTNALRSTTTPEIIDMILAGQAIKRLASPEDQAKAVLFLLSEQAAFITGQILSVDGGSTVRV
jgi:NAD(P)-dependent dehydrogenase (short-subunit alcohol dehydrogenase family)